MIHDLENCGAAVVDRHSTICIIGAGTAGLFLAQRLRVLGIPVIVVESADRETRSPLDVDQHCEQRGLTYRGADSGRAFGLGGTSALWGGQFIPLTREDVGERACLGADAWPVHFEEISSHFPDVRDALGLPQSAADCDSQLLAARFPELKAFSPDLLLRLSEWLPFRQRNFAQAFSTTIETDPDVEIWLNATVREFKVDSSSDNRSVTCIACRSAAGRELKVRAQRFVVCAGALESTRLLLELEMSHPKVDARADSPLGRYFSDHLSVNVGVLKVEDWRRFNHAIAPIFQRGVMRTPRMELSATAQQRDGLTSAFAHFTFVTDGDSGFDVVRTLLRRRQGEGVPLGISPPMALRAIRDTASLSYWRVLHQRLWIPRSARIMLQVDIEQFPNEKSRLLLTDKVDRLGRKRLAIEWRILPEDQRVIHAVASTMAKAWTKSSLTSTAVLTLKPKDEVDDFATLYDVYHPTGTIRMGTDPTKSVVDRNLRHWSYDNLFVSSTAVFPSAGSANPGYTHLALTARLARHLALMAQA